MIDRAYVSIAAYVPEDARRILAEQVAKIEQFIDDEMNKFGEELAEHIGAVVGEVLEEATRDATTLRTELTAAIGEIRADMVANDKVLEGAVSKLERSLDQYETRFKQLGEGVRGAVVTAARASGIPIPNL